MILKVQLVCNDPGSVDGVIAPGGSAELFPAEALKWVSADVHDQLSESIGMDGSADSNRQARIDTETVCAVV